MSSKNSPLREEIDPSSSSASSDVDATVTHWKSVYLCGFIFFLTIIEKSLTETSEWPYMHTIDREATFAFFGSANSIAWWGHILFAPVFSFWSYKFNTAGWPLMTARLIAFLGSCLYDCVELFPYSRRYVLLLCYISFAIASSSSVVIRAYIVLASTPADRARACSVYSLAHMLAIFVGPLLQLIFSSIDYPGRILLPGVFFNLFSAPIWLATFANFFTILLIFFALPEIPAKTKYSQSISVFTLWRNVISSKIQWLRVVFILLLRYFLLVPALSLMQIISPMLISVYGLSNTEVVSWSSICLGMASLISVLTVILLLSTGIGKSVSPRVAYLFTVIVLVVLYVCCFPYTFVSSPVKLLNVSTGNGCNPKEFVWCYSERGTSIWLFVAAVALGIGLVHPIFCISMDTIYSKLVRAANQSLMQGVLVVNDDVVNIIVPLFSSRVFTGQGPTAYFLYSGGISVAGAIIWILAFKKFDGF